MPRGPFPSPKEHPRASRENVLPKRDYSVDPFKLLFFFDARCATPENLPGQHAENYDAKSSEDFQVNKSYRASWSGIFKTT